MAGALHSPMWYRVAGLRPALRSHVRMHRHLYRGRVWYVLHDAASGRSHRFPALTQRLITRMDGKHTVQQIWESAGEELGEHLPTQDEMIRLLSQLHAADLLRVEVAPDTGELFARYERRRKARRSRRFGNPLALRFALWDPDAFLDRTLPAARLLFTRAGYFAWLAVVLAGLSVLIVNWPEFAGNISDEAFTPLNLLLIWLTYPLIKALHELGHAYAAKVRGGEVHEIGIMLLVFLPIPYVDASSASAFPDKRQRMLVGAAGIGVELFVAALAMLVWVLVEPGAVRALAANVALIGGLSTLLFNGNPFLKFDGYYVLADYLEIPNLGPRANRYVGHLFRRRVLRLEDTEAPTADGREKGWLAAYAVVSFAYRLFITIAILLFVIDRVPLVGIPLAIYALLMRAVLPVARGLRSLSRAAAAGGRRKRAVTIASATVAIAAALLFVAPMPLHTRTEGVTWMPPQAEVRAGADATIVRLLAAPGSAVERGDPLIETSDPVLPVRVAVLSAKYREVEARYQAALAEDPVAAATLEPELRAAAADLDLARQRDSELVIRSPAAGVFVVPEPEDLPGRYVRHGDRVAYIASATEGTVIAVLDQDDIGLIRVRTEEVSLRLSDVPGSSLPAVIRREIPAGSDRLPSAALGSRGGGLFAVDPTDEAGTRTLERVFQVELGLPVATERLGTRVYVRFDHGTQPLALQWYRRLRQLLLSHLDA